MKRLGILAAAATLLGTPGRAEALVRTYATSYCLQGRMADGTWVRPRSVAHNFLVPGTRIRLVGRPFVNGMRRFVVRDTGSALRDGHLDIWTASCSTAIQWGRRSVTFKIGWGKP